MHVQTTETGWRLKHSVHNYIIHNKTLAFYHSCTVASHHDPHRHFLDPGGVSWGKDFLADTLAPPALANLRATN